MIMLGKPLALIRANLFLARVRGQGERNAQVSPRQASSASRPEACTASALSVARCLLLITWSLLACVSPGRHSVHLHGYTM